MNSGAWSDPTGPWHGDGVAIVGMAGRFPLADDLGAFWRNLAAGRDCISRFSRDELLGAGVSAREVDHERYVPAGAVLDGIDLFDAAFFGISPREAESMDPQQRFFLEVVQHAFDDAGLDPQRHPGSIAVYAGSRLSGYWLRLMKNSEFMGRLGWHQVAAGNDKDFLATQASFRFDLRGPSVNVQAACSTSLIAVSMGCDALINRRCDVAVAGAASIAIPHRVGYMYQPGSIASSDGRCRPFDATADGSVLGNGVAAIVLKRMQDAIENRDRIYAVLRAVAMNNDGSSKSSFAAPSVRAQAQVIVEALRDAGLPPAAIDYVEAHGTATSLGDPIEVSALSRVFGIDDTRATPLAIGSVKSNIGHLDPAAGLAALIKVALSLSEQQIPPSLHFVRPNPAIDFTAARVRVVQACEPWPRGLRPRRAGVSAFGIGGTNVHAVVEEAPTALGDTLSEDRQPDGEDSQLLLLSAKSPEALRAMSDTLAAHLTEPAPLDLCDVAFTLACGRRQFKYRRTVVGARHEVGRLLADAAGDTPEWVKDRPVVLLFPGQGSQRIGMGLALYRTEPAFRDAVDELLADAEPHLGFDARGLIDPARHSHASERDLTQTALAQPLLFAIEVACARLWMRWGVQPSHLLGHSVGELAAACVAGVMPARDAIRLVCLRGRWMQQMRAGAMLALPTGAAEAEAVANELAPGDACIAAFNSPHQQTLAVSLEALPRVEEGLRERGIAATRLPTSHAFHHGSMLEAAARMQQEFAQVTLASPSMSVMSCMTGEAMSSGEAASANYWARSLVEPVRFSQAAQALLATHRNAVFIECGPGRALGSLLRAHPGGKDPLVLATLPPASDIASERGAALRALGLAWQAGVNIDWGLVWKGRGARRVTLPGYAFQRKRFWVDEAPAPTAATPDPPAAVAAASAGPDNTFVRTWIGAPPAAVAAVDASYVVLAAHEGIGALLAEQLRQDGARVLTVRPGPLAPAEAGGSADRFGVDVDDPAAIRALVDQLTARLPPGMPLQIVNAWTLTLATGAPSVDKAQRGAALAFDAPLHLIRALRAARQSIHGLVTITRQLFPLQPGEVAEPETAPALGLTRVLPQELQGLRARLVDIALPDQAATARLVAQLSAEVRSTAAEAVVAYRAGQRQTEAFAPMTLPPEPNPSTLRPAGCFLITGGFGAIGGVLATCLARASAGARLVLVGRRGAEPGSPGHALVTSLEALGAEVLPATADVTNPAAMRALVEQVHARWGRIDGVVHCAGVPGGRMLMVPGDDAGQVLAPKMQGTLALLEAVAPHHPDFIVMCSSFAALSGGLGQGEYCAANAFIDAMAWTARAMGLRATAVNWPAWREVGMAVAVSLPPELEHLRRASLESGISSQEGAALFLRIVAADLPQVVIAPAVARGAAAVAAAPPIAATAIRPGPSPLPEPHPSLTAGASAADTGTSAGLEAVLTARIGAIWSAVLGSPQPGPDDDFFELGGQSLMALQIVSHCGEQFGVTLDFTALFDHPTLAEFSAVVHARIVERLSAMSDDEVQARLASGRV